MDNRIIRTNGISMNVMVAGNPQGKPVILLHGFPEFWYGWRNQIQPLVDAGYYVWIPDQRGYNLTDKPPDLSDYRMDELVLDIVGLLRATGHEKVNIVGHDWGAMVAWWLALRHPEYIEKLVIMNVPHPQVFEKFIRGDVRQIAKSMYAVFFQLPFLPENLFSVVGSRIMLRFLKFNSKKGSFTDADLTEYKQAWAHKGALTAMLNWYRAYVRQSPAPPTDWQIKPPTLMLWGKHDLYLSHRMAQPSIDLCADGRSELLDATHWVQHDKADEVNRLLLEFLG
ncbi:MAG: alpha/beta hydrolase [Phototrophicales bacterium]|nr:alpha/beta hydrolase [Phototrophicales bacterium]